MNQRLFFWSVTAALAGFLFGFDTVVISGVGGLGHLAVQYAKAMGLHVVAVDISESKLALARKLGADLTINAVNEDPIAIMQGHGGAEGVLVTAVSTSSFSQGFGMLSRRGTMSLVGLPPGDFPLPIYDGDLEDADGLPANAVALKTIFKAHAPLFIVSPEYNGFFPPLLKNTIDWLSRPHGEESGLAPYAGKVAAIAAASPGGLGGIRCLPLLRQQLSNLSVTVLPQQLALPAADRAFDESGALRDAGQATSLQRIAVELVRVAKLLST